MDYAHTKMLSFGFRDGQGWVFRIGVVVKCQLLEGPSGAKQQAKNLDLRDVTMSICQSAA